MKVFVKGQGPVVLEQGDFVGQGGQASVYAKGSVAYKIFRDPGAMIPLEKIRQLEAIAEPDVIKPEALVLDDASGRAIGYTMRYLAGALPLCQLLPPAFRRRHGIDAARTLALVERLQALVAAIHRAGALVVDLNEMNFLVDARFERVFAIDADSYQTKSYPATAISPAVRDPLSAKGDFTELSDWFSFAVLTFQLFVGVHPYRGKHPEVKALSERMRRHLSAFDPAVSLPKIAYGLNAIPTAYREWLRAILQEGRRLGPPRVAGHSVAYAIPAPSSASSRGLAVERIATLPSPIRALFGDEEIVALCDDGIYQLSGRRLGDRLDARTAVGFSPRLGRPIAADLTGRELHLRDLAGGVELAAPVSADAIAASGGRLYAKSGDAVVELVLREVGATVIAAPRVVARVLPKASALFEGVVIQNLLGAAYLSLLRPSGCLQLRVPELDGRAVLDAKGDGNAVVAIVAEDGRYHRLVLRVAGDRCDARSVRDVEPGAVDFVALDRLCVCRDESGRLELWSDRPGSSAMRLCDDDGALAGTRLHRGGGRVLAFGGNVVYRLSTT